MKALLWLLIAWSASVHAAIVVADTTDEGAAVVSIHSVNVDSARDCFGGQDS